MSPALVASLVLVVFIAGVGFAAALHRFRVLDQRRQAEWHETARVRELERQYLQKPPVPWRWGSGPGWREIPPDALKYRPDRSHGNNTCNDGKGASR